MGITEELRHTPAKLVSAAKFALGSALSQVGLKSGSAAAAALLNLVMVEEMKEQQEMNINNRSRSRSRDDDDHLKRLFDEPLNDATPQPQPQRKIFIRSRL